LIELKFQQSFALILQTSMVYNYMSEIRNPLVSIVMCVYNGERYLESQLNSILSQTYQNFELLILDDKSTDNSLGILKRYSQNDSRIVLIENKRNLGFNKNFEKGIIYSKGDLIAISDQDDIWLPEKVELLVANIEDNILIYSNSSLIEGVVDTDQRLDSNLTHIDNPSYKNFLDSNFLTGHTCMFKRELVKHITPFGEDVFFYDWWIGFASSYLGKVKYLDRVLTRYRIHDSSVIQLFSANPDVKERQYQNKRKQLHLFGAAKFLRPVDKAFIQNLIQTRDSASNGFLSYLKCFLFICQNHSDLYPWYKKSFAKKLNFLRKQCLR
jgi:glycosyltransferase involved in cell wall biosynthesis